MLPKGFLSHLLYELSDELTHIQAKNRRATKMSSEELRLDLESFINKGLDQGLRGWPVKG